MPGCPCPLSDNKARAAARRRAAPLRAACSKHAVLKPPTDDTNDACTHQTHNTPQTHGATADRVHGGARNV